MREMRPLATVTKGECRHECGPDLIGQVLLSEKRREVRDPSVFPQVQGGRKSHRKTQREGANFQKPGRDISRNHPDGPLIWTSNPQNNDK